MSPEAKTLDRLSRLQGRARYLNRVISDSRDEHTRDARAAELAAIRWTIRVLFENWDEAVRLVHRSEDADLDPEEGWS